MYPIPIFLWLKAFHIIFIVTWFAGLFYLPRLFVYHAELGDYAPMNSDQKSQYLQFCKMEYRLFWYIMTPSALVTLILGLSLILSTPPGTYQHAGWLHIKLLLVAILLFYHHLCAKHVKRFKSNQNVKTSRYFRYFNEVPSIILILIVILAVTKPF